MKLNDIIDSSMIKLNKHLNNFNKDIFDIYNSDKCEPFYFEKSKIFLALLGSKLDPQSVFGPKIPFLSFYFQNINELIGIFFTLA